MPVPKAFVAKAEVDGYRNIRFWGDAAPTSIRTSILKMLKQRRLYGGLGPSARMRFLALSGGGADGAFGAGLLTGWTKTGKRPKFDVVTGISAGGLLAPFAFLGPAYDAQLTKVFTSFGTSDLLSTNIVAGLLLGGSAIADASGFEALLEKFVDRRMLADIAKQHRRGRRLLIGTTNLDAERAVFWNMGAIAASDHPNALQLFRKVMQASASIPGIFPPVHIKVTVNGESYDELHVDGGVTRQVFFLPSQVMLQVLADDLGITAKRDLYVILNGRAEPAYEAVKPTLPSIAARSLLTLIKNQANGDLAAMFARAKRDGISFRLASIPQEFQHPQTEKFDPLYIKALFGHAHDLGKANGGHKWRRHPRRGF